MSFESMNETVTAGVANGLAFEAAGGARIAPLTVRRLEASRPVPAALVLEEHVSDYCNVNFRYKLLLDVSVGCRWQVRMLCVDGHRRILLCMSHLRPGFLLVVVIDARHSCCRCGLNWGIDVLDVDKEFSV